MLLLVVHRATVSGLNVAENNLMSRNAYLVNGFCGYLYALGVGVLCCCFTTVGYYSAVTLP